MEWYVWLMAFIGAFWGWTISAIDRTERWSGFGIGVVASFVIGFFGFAFLVPTGRDIPYEMTMRALIQGGYMAAAGILGSGVIWALCEAVRKVAQTIVLRRDCKVVPELAKKLQRKNELTRLLAKSQLRLKQIGPGEDTQDLEAMIASAATERNALEEEIPQIRAHFWRQKAINDVTREVTQTIEGTRSQGDLPIAAADPNAQSQPQIIHLG